MIVMSGASNYRSVIKTVYNDIHVFLYTLYTYVYMYIYIYTDSGDHPNPSQLLGTVSSHVQCQSLT